MVMQGKKAKFTNPQGGAAIKVRVNPKARINAIHSISRDGLVTIDLVGAQTAVNDELSAFLADLLHARQGEIEILEGATALDKVVCVIGKDVETVNNILKKQ